MDEEAPISSSWGSGGLGFWDYLHLQSPTPGPEGSYALLHSSQASEQQKIRLNRCSHPLRLYQLPAKLG
jgi:hypothetical protein